MIRNLCLLVTFLVMTSVASTADTRDIIYILDASGSMWAEMSGSTRIEIARDVLADQIPSLKASETNAGLIVYGHRKRGDCGDIENIVPLKPLDERELIAKIESIQPKGKTPIAASIRRATEMLKAREDEATIVLVSDGAENCDPDPCQVVTDLKAAGIEFVLHVVGFDVKQVERRQLQCLARAGGGKYVSAGNAAELTAALEEVVPLEPVILSQENIEIILDSSVEMNDPFDQTTRLSAAKKAVGDVLELQVPDRDNLAFRSFGGSCDGQGTVLHVGFARNNADEIHQSLVDIAAQGLPTLADAVIAAAEDFQKAHQFPADVNKKIIVIAGTDDGCDPQRAANRIYEALEENEIKPEFHFIGLNMPPEKQDQFKRVAGAAGGYFYDVKTSADLTRLLKRIIEVDPVISNIHALIEMTNGITGQTNRYIQALNAEDYQSAESSIAAASELMDGGSRRFADLGKRANSSKVFDNVYEMAKEIRESQHQLLIIAGRTIDFAKSRDTDNFHNAVAEFNTTVKNMNSVVRQLNAAQDELR